MDTINSVVARQFAQERIARAQADRLAKEARQVGSRSRRRPFRRSRRSVVTGVAGAQR